MALNVLEAVLSNDEWQTVNQDVRLKLENCLKTKEEDHITLKSQFDEYRNQAEHKYLELDAKFQQIQAQLKTNDEEFQTVTEVNSQLENELADAHRDQNVLNTKLLQLENSVCNLNQEKDDLAKQLLNRDDELQKMKDELKTVKDLLAQFERGKCESVVKEEEITSKQMALDYKEKRLEQERNLLVRQQQFLQEELDKRTKEVLNVKREMTTRQLQLQTEVAEKDEEISSIQKIMTELTSVNGDQSVRIADLVEELKELNEEKLKAAENNRQELQSQVKLCDLYKASSEEAQAKSDELVKTVEGLQLSLKEASSRFEEAEIKFKDENNQLKRQVTENLQQIEDMKKELDRANTLLDATKSRILSEECIEAMSPSVAAASRLLKSGMSLTQIFSQYVSISEKLLFKEEENKRLNDYIDRIVEEIENRAPSLARQREDYEKSMELVSSLSRQLELAAEEAETERANAEEARRQLIQVEQANIQHQKQVGDLGSQVRCLIKEVEVLRGNEVVDSDEVVSSSDGTAPDSIDPQLITFRHIEELQLKNQKLLHVLRQVSEKQEEVEKSTIESKTARIQQELDTCLTEIQNRRDAERRLEELMASVVQQRDMYRRLVQEAELNVPSSPNKSGTTSTLCAESEGDRTTLELSVQANEVKLLLEQSQQECKALIKEKAESGANLQKLNDQLVEDQSQNGRLTSQVQYLTEKEKLVQGNLDSLKNQLTSLERKNGIYATTVAQHEQSIAILRDEAMNAQQQVARLEVTVTMLREENQLLKDVEQRLLLERNALLSEKQAQNLLHVNLESIKLNLERGECETKMRLENSAASLNQQCHQLRQKLESIEERHEEATKALRDAMHNEKVTALKAAEERAAVAETLAAKLQEQLNASESRARLTSPLIRNRLPVSTSENDQNNELRSLLAQAQSKVENLDQQLKQMAQDAQISRDKVTRLEEELKVIRATAASGKKEMEQQVTRLTTERDTLTQNLNQVQSKLKKIEEQVSVSGESGQVSLKVNQLESELSAAHEKMKEMEESEAKAKEEAQRQVSIARETQEKYERELLQHAATVEQLKSSRQKVEEHRVQVEVLEKRVARLLEELKTAKSSWKSQKWDLEQRSAQLALRCSELDQQIDHMQQQMLAISAPVVVKSHGEEEANKSLNASLSEEETRSSEQLLELIRSLRRQKEIATSRCDVSEAEILRLKTQLEQMQRQLMDLQTQLQREKDKSTSCPSSSAPSAEVLRQLETLNALTDSNRLLRDERVSFLSLKEELVAKVSALEAELQPLRDTSRDVNKKVDDLTAENQTLRKQVVAWKTRTSTLQQMHEKSGRTSAEDIQRLQQDKIQLQKESDEWKDKNAKTSVSFSELQQSHDRLITDQQKLSEDKTKLEEEIQKLQENVTNLQTEVSTIEAKRKEEETKANEKIEPLRRIARKYKAQFEELKAEHDKMVAEQSAASASTAAATAAKEETEAAATAANESQLKELEERHAKLTAEMDQLKKDHETLQAADEKSKNILKSVRTKIGNLQKEKETLAKDLAEAQAKIETLEQGSEESNVRAAALRSQLEGRVARLERENGELVQAKQALGSEIEMMNQRLPLLQRQVEAYQKQKQQQLPPSAPSGKASTSGEKSVADNPPTANIKPMTTSTLVPLRSPSSGGPSPSSTSPVHRATPTASIRPMGMTPRTAAVPPTSVSIAPMAASSTAVAPREDETVEMEPIPSTSRAADEADESDEARRKRVRPTETQGSSSTEQDQKRARVVTEEDVESVEAAETFQLVVDDESSDQVANQSENVIVIQMEAPEEAADNGSSQPASQVDAQPEASTAAIAIQPPASLSIPVSLIRPPAREDRLLPIGRNTMPFEDGGDDGIVPSTPILLRPRPNDGFAEAVMSPQVNTRFIFGSIPDLSVVPSLGGGSGSQSGSLSHLESQGMDDTRMDLSQLDEGTGRSVPSTPIETSSFADLAVADVPTSSVAIQQSATLEDQMPTDAGVELEILCEDDVATEEDSSSTPTTTEESTSTSDSTDVDQPTPGTSSQPVTVISRPPIRRGRGSRPRGRGLTRSGSPQTVLPRLVPISWPVDATSPQPTTPTPAGRGALHPSPTRREGQQISPTATSPVQEAGQTSPTVRGRGRGRPRRARAM